jgi:hypothetical protein
MVNLVSYRPTSLPPRLDGFLKALVAISEFNHPMGGLTIEFPSPGRSADTFERGDLQRIETFLKRALPYGASPYPAARRQSPAEALIEMINDEFDTHELEIWYNDKGTTATLLIGINPGEQEQWLELFWGID